MFVLPGLGTGVAQYGFRALIGKATAEYLEADISQPVHLWNNGIDDGIGDEFV